MYMYMYVLSDTHFLILFCRCENSEGETPLVIAEYAKHDDVVKLLSEASEDAGGPPSTQPSEGLGTYSMLSII